MSKSWCLGILIALSLPALAVAQFGSFGDIPVEITADGETRFEGGVAIAEDNVQIHYGDVGIYTNYAEYNPDTRDVLLIGDIRIYADDNLFTGQRALYNLETKQIRALEFQGEQFPLKFRALSLRAPSLREFRVSDALFTTDDSSQPDFRVVSKRVRVYPDDRVVFSNSTVYIGNVPVFWFPYLFAFTNNSGFAFRPGYDSRWGYYLLLGYSFPIGSGNNFIGTVNTDYRTELGMGIGFDAEFQYGKNDRSFGTFKSYYAYDTDPEDKVGGPGEPAEPGDHDRYRVSFQHRLFLTDDIYATFDINKLSDIDFLEDYFPNEFRVDPQPDNYIGVTKWDEFYTLSLLTRFQLNDFYETTERLPELALDFKQHQLFGLPIYYDGENSLAELRRAFADTSVLEDYESARFDTFHQLSFPKTYFGWLSLIPRIGVRGTYYSQTGKYNASLSDAQVNQVASLYQQAQSHRFSADATGDMISSLQSQLNSTTDAARQAELQDRINSLSASRQNQLAAAANNEQAAENLQNNAAGFRGSELDTGGSTFRPVLNAGIEGSFKISKKYERIQSRLAGLDGVLHVVQPYFNYSYVYNAGKSRDEILQFDRVVPATEPLAIDFPQFVAIDSIDTWSILRLGIRNHIKTRRGNENFAWLDTDSFFDLNFDNPYIDNGEGSVSNVVNRITWRPLPWAAFIMGAQLPVTDDGFTDVNTSILFMPVRDLLLQITDRYIEDNPFFRNSNQISGSAYYQVTSNWAVSMQGTYEAESDTLLLQRYMVHRDLSSWIVSVGGVVRENVGGETDYGLEFSMSLKDAPQVSLPLAFDQGTGPLGSENNAGN